MTRAGRAGRCLLDGESEGNAREIDRGIADRDAQSERGFAARRDQIDRRARGSLNDESEAEASRRPTMSQ